MITYSIRQMISVHVVMHMFVRKPGHDHFQLHLAHKVIDRHMQATPDKPHIFDSIPGSGLFQSLPLVAVIDQDPAQAQATNHVLRYIQIQPDLI